MRTLNETWETTVAGGNTQTLPIRPAAQLASHADIVAHMRACPVRRAQVADNDQGRVFVVDACHDLAASAKMVLEQAGYPARTFDNATTAWHAFAFANPKPDMLITHEGVGEMSGLELIGHCRQIHPGLKTLLITNRRLGEFTRPERALVDGIVPTTDCGPLLAERAGRWLRNEGWHWKKLWGAWSRGSRKCLNAAA
jgi:CheY-like chemotaxis protein